MGLRAGLDRCGKSRPTGIRSPDHPAHRQSLYRLSYPAHCILYYNLKFKCFCVGRHRNVLPQLRILQLFCVFDTNSDRHTRVLNVLGQLAPDWGIKKKLCVKMFHVVVFLSCVTVVCLRVKVVSLLLLR